MMAGTFVEPADQQSGLAFWWPASSSRTVPQTR